MILGSVASDVALHSVEIDFGSSVCIGRSKYSVSRTDLLDSLLEERILNIMDGFPSLRRLHLRLNDRYREVDYWECTFRHVWWEVQTERRLSSRLCTIVTMRIDYWTEGT